MEIEAILAHDLQKGISLKNKIPWKSKKDMYFFKNTTINNIVIMGSKTFESLPNKLTNRLNIVLTNNPNKYNSKSDDDVIFMNGFGLDIINQINNNISEYKKKYNFLSDTCKIFVIGGDDIYNQFIPFCNVIWLTLIQSNYSCDKFFTVDLDNLNCFTKKQTYYSDSEMTIYKYSMID